MDFYTILPIVTELPTMDGFYQLVLPGGLRAGNFVAIGKYLYSAPYFFGLEQASFCLSLSKGARCKTRKCCFLCFSRIPAIRVRGDYRTFHIGNGWIANLYEFPMLVGADAK